MVLLVDFKDFVCCFHIVLHYDGHQLLTTEQLHITESVLDILDNVVHLLLGNQVTQFLNHIIHVHNKKFLYPIWRQCTVLVDDGEIILLRYYPTSQHLNPIKHTCLALVTFEETDALYLERSFE